MDWVPVTEDGAPTPPPTPTAEVLRPSAWAAMDLPFRVLIGLLFIGLSLTVSGIALRAPSLTLLGIFDLLQILPAFFVTLAPSVRILFTRYVIDDEGIRVQAQILARTESRVAWEKVTAVRYRRTLLDRMLGLSRLDVVAYGERGTTLHLVGLREGPALRDRTARMMRRSATIDALLSND